MPEPSAGIVGQPCNSASQPGLGGRRRYLGVLLCFGVSGVFLYLAARKTDFAQVRNAFAATQMLWLLPMVIVSSIDFWLRAVRWSWMFPPDCRPAVRQAFSTYMIGTLANNFVPGRLGDVARSGMIGRLVPLLGTTGALATVVLEKVVDGLMLLALLGVALLLAPLPAWLGNAGMLGSLIFLGSLVFLLVINARAKTTKTDFGGDVQQSRFGRVFSAAQSILQRFALGLNALNSKRQALIVLSLTLAIWMLEFCIMFIVFLMFGLSLPFTAAMVTGVILSIGMMIPAAPGSIGTYQFFTVTGLQLYHVPGSEALALAVFLNLFVFANTTLFGLLALSVEGMSWVSYWRGPLGRALPISNRNR